MADIIKLLPENLANQIAAGEVVQRPASVVKELLENSVDAGSNHIELIIKDAGKALIQIIDDGKGMSETDARMCFERHATSKIKTTDDLFSIRTFGFRGEALASIAAVAQVELKTKRENEELGTIIKIEGSEVKLQEATACDKGTSIAVKNLFYNVPARRNFLKSNPVEIRHIIDEFQRVALAYPHIAFTFFQNDLEMYKLPSEKLSKRIISLFGASYKEQLTPCQEETDFIKVQGYIGKPEHAKKTRGEQFFFVNNRFIKNNYLHHAVMNAYEDLLPDDSFPFYVIYIDIDPRHIDINVHPTKTEIKFDDEKSIYAFIRSAVKKALATHNITPSLDFDHNINFNHFPDESVKEVSFGQKTFSGNPAKESNRQNWQELYQHFDKQLHTDKNMEIQNQEKSSIILGSAVNDIGSGTVVNKELLYTENQSTFQLHQRYIVTQIKSGMAVIDQQAAHERILYEKYYSMLHNKFGASQQFLFPQSIELNPSDFSLVMELEEEIRSLGFVFNIFGKNTIVVNGIPADVPSGSEKGLFEGLIEQFKIYQSDLKLETRETLARSMARKSALKPGTKLTLLEMNTLIDQLFACKSPMYAPNGNATIVIMDLDRLSKLFK
ncbi:MAG: DNA mismatch repair endonuclease MutL [Cytophagaceae bacterium]|nr:DNA mismatch repair endonuclease MutL [Cytophagaceae bacterium]